MNRVEYKDLVPDQLYWYVVYEGESKPPSQTLMKVLTAAPELTVQNVLTNEIVEPFPIYAYFETVHPQYVENQIKALEAQQLRVAEQLAIFKAL
jgi:hypothetical protein